jgi:uncharacterized membrane protein YfcA
MAISNSVIILYLKDYYMEYKTSLIQSTISILGVSISFLESIEIYARIAGAFVGITVGIFTIYRLWLDIKLKRKQIKNDASNK